MNTIEVINEWNKQRKTNKDKWLFFEANLDGSTVLIKSYNLWIQRIEYRDFIDGKDNKTVKDAKDFLFEFLEH